MNERCVSASTGVEVEKMGVRTSTTVARKKKLIENDENVDPNYERYQKTASKVSCLVPGKGQLKIAIYFNYGLLTVHVIQGRHLKSRWKAVSDSFVKISLVPDNDRCSRSKTEVIQDTNNPLYDQKFSFELLDEDKNKRLLISTWHKDFKHGRCEFLGCMSFGARHLLTPKRPVGGWYYLLTEETGRRKHLPAPSGKPAFGLREKAHKNIPDMNSDVLVMDAKVIKMQKSKSGYGFTLTGESPAFVSRVEQGSPAVDSGLAVGDFILTVNGQNVSRSTSECIGRTIRYERHCQQQIILDIRRRKTDDHAKERDILVSEKDVIESPDCNGGFKKQEFPVHHTTPTLTLSTSSPTSTLDGNSSGEIKTNRDNHVKSRGVGIRTSTPPLSVVYQELPDHDVFRQQAISRLVELEETYIKNMQVAVQRYCLPLKKSAIISSNDYQNLFLNVEKLLNVSEYYVRQLKLNSLPYIDIEKHGEGFIDAVGFIYTAKLQLLCELYGSYCANLDKAKSTIYALVSRIGFRRFLENAVEEDPTILLGIEDFICKPHQHVWQVLVHLQSIQVYTATEHHDYPFLEEVVNELHHCCNQANSNLTQNVQYSPFSSRSSVISRSTTSSSLSTVSSVDSEMMQLNNRTVFAKNVKEIPLCVPNRHLIYAGALSQVTTVKHSRQTWVMLFSDVILVTEKENDTTVVIEDPIFIHDLVHQDYERSNENEFQLICRLTGISYQSLVFESPSLEYKHAWKTLLQQRVDVLRANETNKMVLKNGKSAASCCVSNM